LGTPRWGFRDQPQDERPLIREPVRFAVVAGAVLTLLGTLLPWSSRILPDGGRDSVSIIAATDGTLLAILAGAVLLLALSRSVAESKTRTLQAAVGVLGVVGFLTWLGAIRADPAVVANRSGLAWTIDGNAGPIVCGIGTAIVAGAGSLLSLLAWRRNGTVAR
jgi:hypothetical protein